MKTLGCHQLLAGIFLLIPAPLHGDSTLDANHSFAYSANLGWLELRPDLPTAPEGVVVTEFVFSGFGYAANAGWIHFGNGSPSNEWHSLRQ